MLTALSIVIITLIRREDNAKLERKLYRFWTEKQTHLEKNIWICKLSNET